MHLQRHWSTSSASETPPPPYSKYEEAPMAEAPAPPRTPRKPQARAQPRQEPIPDVGPFPPSWNLYRTMSAGRALVLGAHENEPIAALPPLATGTGGVGVGRHSIIVLPALRGSRLDWSQELLLRVDDDDDDGASRKSRRARFRFRFAVEVGPDPQTARRREVFEWRHSRGDAVAAFLDGAGAGWELVRLSDGGNGGGLVWPRSGDGREIVAVWSRARRRSLTKVLKFRFLGSGAMGVLGERWVIMAVMTALRMYQHHQRNRNGDW
ncbi:hypothetical protein F4818DRAFT_454864 [Hypoxylon cercidicola]|nr:hypothetical protein F4818DRAFT_454864 [Hypoxylon cercidicola]